MSTTYGATGFGQTAASPRRVSGYVKSYWCAFEERRDRDRMRAVLYSLSDWEKDIGIARDQIEYVALNRSFDPRGIRSIPPMIV